MLAQLGRCPLCGTSHFLELLHPQLGCAGCPSLGMSCPGTEGASWWVPVTRTGGSVAIPAPIGMMFPIPRKDEGIVGSLSALWAVGICSKVGLWDLSQPFSNHFLMIPWLSGHILRAPPPFLLSHPCSHLYFPVFPQSQIQPHGDRQAFQHGFPWFSHGFPAAAKLSPSHP